MSWQKLPSINYSYCFLVAYVCSCVWIAQVYFALSALLWLPVYSLVNDYHQQGHYDQGHIFTRSTAYQTWCFIGKLNNYTADEILTPENTLHNRSLWEVNRLLMGCATWSHHWYPLKSYVYFQLNNGTVVYLVYLNEELNFFIAFWLDKQ